MLIRILLLLLLSNCQSLLWAQREDIPLLKERQDFAARSVQELKEDGAIVLRLRTNYRKLQIMERTLRSSKLKPAQRKRHQLIYEGTIKRRDAFNESLKNSFTKHFKFCPVYVMYDTSSKALRQGIRTGIFLDEQGNVDANIQLKEQHVFIANFKDKGATFPYDVLYLQRLEEKLCEPFPYFIGIRESWVNSINTPRAAKSVEQLDKKLALFLQRAVVYQEKQKEKANKKENKTQP